MFEFFIDRMKQGLVNVKFATPIQPNIHVQNVRSKRASLSVYEYTKKNWIAMGYAIKRNTYL